MPWDTKRQVSWSSKTINENIKIIIGNKGLKNERIKWISKEFNWEWKKNVRSNWIGIKRITCLIRN